MTVDEQQQKQQQQKIKIILNVVLLSVCPTLLLNQDNQFVYCVFFIFNGFCFLFLILYILLFYFLMKHLLFIVLLMSLKINGHGEGSCPNVCICKWKGGKQTVECRNLHLKALPDAIDPITQVLDMTGNQLHHLPREMFINSDLMNLQKLFLKSCHLKKVEDNAFLGLSNLVDLDLSYNYLTVVPTNALNDIPSLRELYLADNPITQIEDNAFRNVLNLIKLDLSNNMIEFVNRNAFNGLELLQSLKINGNKLQGLEEHTIKTLSGLHGIQLHDNPWFCDCRMRIAKLWLTEKNIPLTVSPVCSAGPDSTIGRKFTDLNVDDFACKPEMLPVTRHIKVFSSHNATVKCKAYAVPAAKIKWYWNGKLVENHYNSINTGGARAVSTISSSAIGGGLLSSSPSTSSTQSVFKRIHIFEVGNFHKQSSLILTNAQEIDSSELYCVAENRAGNTEMNFTLHVTMSSAGLTAFGNNQIVTVSAILAVLLLVMTFVIFTLIVRIRNDTHENRTGRESKIPRQRNDCDEHRVEQLLPKKINNDGSGGVLNDGSSGVGGNVKLVNGTMYMAVETSSPTDSNENNPDLINDTRQLSDSDLVNLDTAPKIVNYINKYCSIDSHNISSIHDWSTATLSTTTQTLNEPIYLNQSTATLPTYISSSSSSTAAIIPPPTASSLDDTTQLVDRTQIFNQIPSSNSSSLFGPASADQALHQQQQFSHQYQHHYLQQQQQHSNEQQPPTAADYMSKIFFRTSSMEDYDLADVTSSSNLNNKTRGHTLPNYMIPSNAKTLRVWQSGGVSVLPPLTAMKRILTTANRNSPDEGYQEGCGTDV